MRNLLLLLTLMLSPTFIFAQQVRDLNSNKKNTTFSEKLWSYTDSIFRHTTRLNKCVTGYSFVRFMVDKKGELSHIESNEGTPAFLDSVFKEMLVSLNQMPGGFFKHDRNLINKYHLLPISYSLRGACVIDTSSQKYTALEWMLRSLPDVNGQQKTGKREGFMDMVNFKGDNKDLEKKGSVSYIIIPPFQVNSPVKEKW